MSKTNYTDAQKAAYYKKKYLARSKSASTYVPKKRTYRKARASSTVARKPGALSSAGKIVGGGLGSAFGPAGTGVGSFLGGKLGHLIETVTGFGDYKIENNSVLSGGMSVPQVVNSLNKGGVIVRHREYIGDIQATVAFTVQKFVLNPGLPQTFPWLSQMANSFEQYALRGVLFEFVSTSSDALLSSATSTALGSVMMSTDYDVADLPPADKRTMLNSEFSSSEKPSQTFIHPIECKRSQTAQNILYTRAAAVPEGYDARLYDFANFYIATEGMQANGGNLGELWVTYEVELMKQQFVYLGLTDHFRMSEITTTRPLGTVVGSNLAAGGTIGGFISGDALSYSFPPLMGAGKFLVAYTVYATTPAVITLPEWSFTNCEGLYLFQNDILEQVGAPNNAAAAITRWSKMCVIQITKQEASLTFDAGSLPLGTSAGDFWVTRIADSITFLP